MKDSVPPPPDHAQAAGATGPWFASGLRFECTQCGHCCTGAPGYVWVNEDELQAIADFTGRPVGEIRVMHTRRAGGAVTLLDYANGDCTFFDPQTRGCRIYPVRPRQCRTWPFWNSNLESPAAWQETARGCPGCNHGPLYPLEEIQQRAAVIDL